MAAVWGYAEPLRILCTRELQISIKESFHAELKNAIESEPWLSAAYDVGVDYIRGKNGTEFIFRGLRHNMSSIKSMAQIDLCIVEEAEDVPEASWVDLEPTIRKDKSEIWVIWNPKTEDSPVDKRFRKSQPPGSVIVELNWRDNPWFPQRLEDQRKLMQERDPNAYAYIWEGGYWAKTDAQVLGDKWSVREFEAGPQWDGPYYGADWGFSQDPSTLIEAWHHEDTLYIRREAYRHGVEVTDYPAFWGTVDNAQKYVVRCDNARPELISHMRSQRWQAVAADKWPGSVEDGITWLRSRRQIVIHPACRHTTEEARLWSHKTNKAGDVLPELVDGNDHCWDAIRYGLQPLIRADKGPRIRAL